MKKYVVGRVELAEHNMHTILEACTAAPTSYFVLPLCCDRRSAGGEGTKKMEAGGKGVHIRPGIAYCYNGTKR